MRRLFDNWWGASSIGQAVSREIFKCDPKALHVTDISENNMVELVRDRRSLCLPVRKP